MINVTEDQARNAVRIYPHVASEMKLGKQAIKTYLYIASCGNVTADELCREFGISIQHANQLLKTLIKKGYVDRFSKPQKSGGYEFVYTEINSKIKPKGDAHLQSDLLK